MPFVCLITNNNRLVLKWQTNDLNTSQFDVFDCFLLICLWCDFLDDIIRIEWNFAYWRYVNLHLKMSDKINRRALFCVTSPQIYQIFHSLLLLSTSSNMCVCLLVFHLKCSNWYKSLRNKRFLMKGCSCVVHSQFTAKGKTTRCLDESSICYAFYVVNWIIILYTTRTFIS